MLVHSARPGPRTLLESSLLGLGVFVLYASGASRTVYVGDSGELTAAVAVLGIPHPTGYPLYVLAGKLWTWLVPVGSVAYRMSLFSAATAAAACGALFAVVRGLGAGRVAAAFAALLLAAAPSLWGEANVQRVYALNAVFVVLAAGAALRWQHGRRDADLLACFFLCGLGASNHTFLAVQAVATAAFALSVEPGLWRRTGLAVRSAAAAGLGLLPYAYLPIRSRMDPPLDWGNPETLDAFLGVVLRRDFWGRAWIHGLGDVPVIAADYLSSFGRELAWAGTALAALALVRGRRRWPVALPVLVMAANLGVMALHGSRTDLFVWHRYYVPSYAMGALLAGLGAQLVAERLPRRLGPALLAIPVLALVVGYPRFDRSRYRIAEDFSRTLLETLPPGAHLAANDDNILFVLIYLHLAEGRRPDVDLILEGVGGATLAPLRFKPETDPLFLTHHPNWSVAGLEVVPIGLAFQTVRQGARWPEPRIPEWRLDGESDPRVPKDYLTQNLVGHFHYMLGVTLEHRDWPRALQEFGEAQRAAPGNDVLFYNLGLILERNGWLPEALEAFETSTRINPRAIASAQRAVPGEKVAQLRGELAEAERIEARLAQAAPVRETPGSGAFHREMARRLDEAGVPMLARGHRLRAEIADSQGRS